MSDSNSTSPGSWERNASLAMSKLTGVRLRVTYFIDLVGDREVRTVVVAREDGQPCDLDLRSKLARLMFVDGVRAHELETVALSCLDDPGASEHDLLLAFWLERERVRAHGAASVYAIANPGRWEHVFG